METAATQRPLVLVYMCDSVYAKILAKRLEREGAEVKVFGAIDDLLTRGTQKLVSGILLDVQCELSVEELVKRIKGSPVLYRAFRALYSEVLLPQEVDLIAHKEVNAVYVGALQSATEISEHFVEELKSLKTK